MARVECDDNAPLLATEENLEEPPKRNGAEVVVEDRHPRGLPSGKTERKLTGGKGDTETKPHEGFRG